MCRYATVADRVSVTVLKFQPIQCPVGIPVLISCYFCHRRDERVGYLIYSLTVDFFTCEVRART